jgi:hypothetical protein
MGEEYYCGLKGLGFVFGRGGFCRRKGGLQASPIAENLLHPCAINAHGITILSQGFSFFIAPPRFVIVRYRVSLPGPGG